MVIYDIEQIEGIDFITMEYVPGKTMAEVIGRSGLMLPEALNYGFSADGFPITLGTEGTQLTSRGPAELKHAVTTERISTGIPRLERHTPF